MKRVTLHSANASSELANQSATNRHPNDNGSGKWSGPASGLFSHFMLIAGILLISLLTSSKVLAENYTVTLTGSNLTVNGGATATLDQAVRSFTLAAAAGHKLPEAASITVSITEGANLTYCEDGDLTADGNGAKWSYDGAGTITLGAEVELSSGITVTADGVALSTDAKLKTLTYSVDGGDPTDVTTLVGNDTETPKTYEVTLPATTPRNAVIAIEAEANNEFAVVASESLSATLAENAATIELTVTPESGAEGMRTITINFTRTPSNDVTLSALQYTIGEGEPQEVEDLDNADTDGATYNVVLPFGTAADATITILATATDAGFATITGDESVTLSEGVGSATITITAEDESTNQQVVISFTTAPEQITNVIVPEKFTLAEEDGNTSDKAIAQLAAMDGVVIETNGSTEMKLKWEYKAGDNGSSPYNTGHGQKNVFSWSVVRTSDDDASMTGFNNLTITGTTEVANYIAAVTGDQSSTDLEITANDPYSRIGGEEEVTTVKSITVSAAATENLTLDNVAVTNGLTVNAALPTLSLKQATIAGTLNVTASATGLSLEVDQATTIDKITNAGTLALHNAAANTRAAGLANTGGITEIENNGVFTDETGTIYTVGGNADLAIATLPVGKSTTGSSVALTVAAASTSGTVTYQWQKQINGSWVSAQGTGNNTAELMVGKNDNGQGSYRCKVMSQNGGAVTTLYTPAVFVEFKTSVPPSPSTPTYTVWLPMVEGATFSKGQSTTVSEGDDFSFTITLDKEYSQSKPVVKVDNAIYEADANGVYVIKSIARDITIVVSNITKDVPTGIDGADADAVRVWSESSMLYIQTPEAAEVAVYSVSGALMHQYKAVAETRSLSLPAGLYMVRIGDSTIKTVIR